MLDKLLSISVKLMIVLAYYCKKSKDEEIIILTSDRDLLQLISNKVSIHMYYR